MSFARGSTNRTRPQKHQNRTSFKNDLHDSSHKTKLLNSLEITGVCKRCKDILDWKIKYKKYKPLTAPRKCVGCDQKTVKHAYHMLCSNCATEKKVCAKCCKPHELNENQVEETQNKNIDTHIKFMLKQLPERKRRTIQRYLNKNQDGNQQITPEIMSQIEDMVEKLGKINVDDNDDFFFDDEAFSDLEDDSGKSEH